MKKYFVTSLSFQHQDLNSRHDGRSQFFSQRQPGCKASEGVMFDSSSQNFLSEPLLSTFLVFQYCFGLCSLFFLLSFLVSWCFLGNLISERFLSEPPLSTPLFLLVSLVLGVF